MLDDFGSKDIMLVTAGVIFSCRSFMHHLPLLYEDPLEATKIRADHIDFIAFIFGWILVYIVFV